MQPSASGPLIRRGKTVSGLHGSAVLVQCGSADVGPIKYGRACPVPRRRGRPGGGPLWEFEIGPPLGQRDIAVWVGLLILIVFLCPVYRMRLCVGLH